MVYYIKIRPSEHYLEEHAQDVPLEEVVSLILRTKNPRKKGMNFEIEKDGYYVLFEIKNRVLYIINAKRSLK